MKVQEVITEIDATVGVEPLTISDSELIKHSKVVGDIDGREVLLYSNNMLVFMFATENKVDAFISLTTTFELNGIKNNSETGGLVTALIGFVTHRLKQSITIPAHEPLTPDGKDWLVSLIKANGRGLTIKDQTGQFPDADAIDREWNTALRGIKHGSTSIIIESNMTRHFPTNEERRSLLMSYTFWIGDKNLI